MRTKKSMSNRMKKAQKVDWESDFRSSEQQVRRLNEAYRDASDASKSFQRQRDKLQNEEREQRDLAESRRQQIDALTADKDDLAQRLKRRNADYDLLAALICRVLTI